MSRLLKTFSTSSSSNNNSRLYNKFKINSFNSFNLSKKNFFSKPKLAAKDNENSLLNLNNDIKISFYSKIQVCKDTYIFRFLLPESDSNLGHKICQYIYLEATLPKSNEIVKRPYHPISLDTDKGFIDIMIKIYPKEISDPYYGQFSNYLSTLEEGQVIKMSGPSGNIQYNGNGEFAISKNTDTTVIKKVNKVGMIAGGTGITPMFQLIQKIISSRDRTGVSLIYGTKFIEDIAFCEDLVNYDKSGKLSFYPVVETPTASKWVFGSGRVTEAMIQDYMPSPKDTDSVIFLCGPKSMVEDYLKPMLRSMNFQDDNILSFL